MLGWIYVFSNKSMPGLVKVGYTTREPEIRARELENTATPFAFKVEFAVLVDEVERIEASVHASLHKSGKHADKEWFSCSAESAIQEIKAIAGEGLSLRQVEELNAMKRDENPGIGKKRIEREETGELERREREERNREAALRSREGQIRLEYSKILDELFPKPTFSSCYSLAVCLLTGGIFVASFFVVGFRPDTLIWCIFLGAFTGLFVAPAIQASRLTCPHLCVHIQS